MVRLLAGHRVGLTKNAIIDALPELSTGGSSTDLLRELEESGFIAFVQQFGQKKKGGRYILTDEYSLFYLTWVEPVMGPGTRTIGTQYWLRRQGTPSYRSWAGLSFESLCFKHLEQIIRALDLTVVATGYGGWRSPLKAAASQKGAQIDLVIERADRCINLCELKFAENEFAMTKEYAQELQRKKEVFRQVTQTKATLFTTLIASCGVHKTSGLSGAVESALTLDDLFL